MRDLIQKGILTFLLPEIQRGRGYKLKLGWIFPLQKFFRQIFIILKISPYPSLRKRGVEKIGKKLSDLFPLLLPPFPIYFPSPF